LSTELLINDIKEVSERVRSESTFLVIFSDDGDGISSAAIFSSILEELGKEYSLVCLDKIFPDALRLIYEHYADMYVYLDLGGPIFLYTPPDLRNRILIVDHHEEKVLSSNIMYLNPAKYNKTGNYATTSVMTYFIHRAIKGNKTNLSWLSLIGIGEIEGEFTGLNWAALTDALSLGLAERVVRESKLSLKVKVDSRSREIKSLYRDITLVSSVNYYYDGPLSAVEALIFKDIDFVKKLIDKAKQKRMEAFTKCLKYLESEGLFQLKNVQWFKDIGFFEDMGTRVFDSFTSFIRFQSRLLNRRKYILGLMNRRSKIPGLGSVKGRWINIAIRVPKYLETLILAGKFQPVSALAEAAAFQVDGIGYGYPHIGSAVIPEGSEDLFISIFNEMLSEEK